MFATDLVAAFQRAAVATDLAVTLSHEHAGNPDVFPTMAHVVITARDAYAAWTEAAGRETVAPELLRLGQVARAWVDTLTDDAVRSIAAHLHLPIPLIGHVSMKALRFWINPAWEVEHPRKRHIVQTAMDRFAHNHGSEELAAVLAAPVVTLVRIPNGVRPSTSFLALTGM